MSLQIAALPQPFTAFFWSVRRELWENRIVLLAPAAVAATVLVGVLVGLPFGIFAGLADPSRQKSTVFWVLNAASFFVLVTALVAALFYCLEALHGERRDRSILFFKSLPVSDVQTVLAKLFVPAVLLPLGMLVLVLALNLVLVVLTTAVLAISGHAAASLWSSGVAAIRPSCFIYALSIATPWYLPLYCSLLTISAWAKHSPLLWVGLPLILADACDRLVFHSGEVEAFYLYRLFGWFDEGLRVNAAGLPIGRTFDRYLTSPGLWLGLAAAAGLFAVAVHLRRRAQPI